MIGNGARMDACHVPDIFVQGGGLMYTRILVPLDGSSSAKPAVKPALEYSFSEPSFVSSLVDRLETQAQTYPNAIPASRQWDTDILLEKRKFQSRGCSGGRRRDVSQYMYTVHGCSSASRWVLGASLPGSSGTYAPLPYCSTSLDSERVLSFMGLKGSFPPDHTSQRRKLCLQ